MERRKAVKGMGIAAIIAAITPQLFAKKGEIKKESPFDNASDAFRSYLPKSQDERFRKLLTNKAKKVYDTKTPTTVHEYIVENEDGSAVKRAKLVRYVTNVYTFKNEEEEEIQIKKAVKKLAKNFNKGVEKGIFGMATMSVAFSLNIGSGRGIVIVYPTCLLEGTDKEVKRAMRLELFEEEEKIEARRII